MPKISEEPMREKLVTFYASDLTYLNSLFKGHIGVNKIIRGIVRSYVNHAKARAAEKIDQMQGQTATVSGLDEAAQVPQEVWDRLIESIKS